MRNVLKRARERIGGFVVPFSRNKWKGRFRRTVALGVCISVISLVATATEPGFHAVQQATGKMKGKIADSNGEPLPGATVQVVGSQRGVIADENGNYELDGIAQGTQVIVSYIGMESKVVKYQ
ncbi:MAG: carboxypeptidase-like regulatory domain-containing protein, partial [Tannerella sp.]|nr:carboxypeptidase-like regulatory domain-containing protein [Tannerella sp.]